MSDSPPQILSLSSFNGELVTTYFNVGKDRPEEYAAMRFVFKMMKDEISGSKKTDAGQTAADHAIEKIAFRYDLYKNYADDFFQNHNAYDLKPLCLAVICDEYLNSANEPLQPKTDEEEPIHRNDGFDDEILARACCMWEEACIMESQGVPEEFFPSSETVFLAHIHAIGNLRDLEESLEDYEIEDLLAIRDKDFPCVRNFIYPQTGIGKTLQSFLDHMTARIDAIAAPPPPRGGHLRLVPEQPS